MKILIDKQIKGADLATIEREPVESIELMERAAELIAQWICNNVEQGIPLLFFVGKGNNGGDGLAAARMLSSIGYGCTVMLPFTEGQLTDDCLCNLKRLPASVNRVDEASDLEIYEDTVFVDALLGTGVVGEVNEPIASLIELINSLPNRVISIDLPSGMKCEFGNNSSRIVTADTTLTIEQPKLAMMLPEAGNRCGTIDIMQIDLDADYIEQTDTPYYFTTEDTVKEMFMLRSKFDHKGNFGHALLVCGSEGMIGAAVLAASAALRSGCGLVTVHTPATERFAVQANCPSAILSLDQESCFSNIPTDLSKYNAIGVGCGIGNSDATKFAFIQLLKACRTQNMVFDADALNILAEHPELFSLIPPNSILTPHIGELRRMVGEWVDEQQKIQLVQNMAKALHSIIVIKGAHSMVCLPDGSCNFNSTGCSGMAKGGSGDLLTGFITGLLARGYEPINAAMLGVYIHGKAGEKAADYYGVEGMNSSDISDFLAEVSSEL